VTEQQIATKESKSKNKVEGLILPDLKLAVNLHKLKQCVRCWWLTLGGYLGS
jgi:hypothetical protein